MRNVYNDVCDILNMADTKNLNVMCNLMSKTMLKPVDRNGKTISIGDRVYLYKDSFSNRKLRVDHMTLRNDGRWTITCFPENIPEEAYIPEEYYPEKLTHDVKDNLYGIEHDLETISEQVFRNIKDTSAANTIYDYLIGICKRIENYADDKDNHEQA